MAIIGIGGNHIPRLADFYKAIEYIVFIARHVAIRVFYRSGHPSGIVSIRCEGIIHIDLLPQLAWDVRVLVGPPF
ncbi:hypothetical protein ES703_89615 [subsurface metagenome]